MMQRKDAVSPLLSDMRAFGQILYGDRWVNQTANMMGLNRRTMQRIVRGEPLDAASERRLREELRDRARHMVVKLDKFREGAIA